MHERCYIDSFSLVYISFFLFQLRKLRQKEFFKLRTIYKEKILRIEMIKVSYYVCYKIKYLLLNVSTSFCKSKRCAALTKHKFLCLFIIKLSIFETFFSTNNFCLEKYNHLYNIEF